MYLHHWYLNPSSLSSLNIRKVINDFVRSADIEADSPKSFTTEQEHFIKQSKKHKKMNFYLWVSLLFVQDMLEQTEAAKPGITKLTIKCQMTPVQIDIYIYLENSRSPARVILFPFLSVRCVKLFVLYPGCLCLNPSHASHCRHW